MPVDLTFLLWLRFFIFVGQNPENICRLSVKFLCPVILLVLIHQCADVDLCTICEKNLSEFNFRSTTVSDPNSVAEVLILFLFPWKLSRTLEILDSNLSWVILFATHYLKSNVYTLIIFSRLEVRYNMYQPISCSQGQLYLWLCHKQERSVWS